MKIILMSFLSVFVASFAFANNVSENNPCAKNERQGEMVAIQSLAPQMVGEQITSSDFNMKIYHKTQDGNFVLSLSGIAHAAKEDRAVTALLECDSATGLYVFVGAGTVARNR